MQRKDPLPLRPRRAIRCPEDFAILLGLGRSTDLFDDPEKGRSGAAAVEFALVIPALLLLIFAAAYLGIYIGLAHSLQQISSDASRYAMVGLNAAERQALASDAITKNAGTYSLIDANWLSYHVEEQDRWMTVSVVYDLSDSKLPAVVSNAIGQIGSLERSATVMLP